MDLIKPFFDYLNRDKKLLLHTVLLLTGGFLLLTFFVYLLPTSFLDIEFSEEVQEDRNPWLDMGMTAISWFGGLWVAPLTVGLTALLFFVSSYRREAWFTLSTLLTGAVSYGVKILVNRPRPTEDLVQIIEKAQFQSFPSGHTVFYVAFFGWLVFLMYRLTKLSNPLRLSVAIFSLFLIFTIPFSRVYLGAHWFTDVAAGFILGLLLLVGLIQTYLGKIYRS